MSAEWSNKNQRKSRLLVHLHLFFLELAMLCLFSFFLSFRMPSNQRLKYIGLANQGNTCYMNSYLQTLFHLSEFMRLVLKIPTKAEPLKFPDSL